MSKNILYGYLAMGFGNFFLLMSWILDPARFGVGREFGRGFLVGIACVLLLSGLVLFLKSIKAGSGR
jgi:hypothetical protein